jgi:hypothetical protein
MAEYPLTVGTVPDSTCYPATVQPLLNLVADYSTLIVPGNQVAYIISDTVPSAENQDKLWFQVGSSGSGYGSPKVIRWYVNGVWLEFAQLSRGDRIFVSANSAIVAPWGEYGYTYSFAGLGVSPYAPTQAPTPPDGLKYKTYVGYWTSKSP